MKKNFNCCSSVQTNHEMRKERIMKEMKLGIMAKIVTFVVIALLVVQVTAKAVPIFGNGTLGNFVGDISYNASIAELDVTLTNTSPVDNGGYVTAFAFNNPFDSITDVSLSSSESNFVLIGGSSFNNSVAAMPYGDFDIGVSLSDKGNNPFQGGGKPQNGIGVGVTETFTFSLTGVGLSNLSLQDFLGELSIGNASEKQPTFFIARFRGFNDGGSNKALANAVPEPTTILLLGIGLGGLGGLSVLRRFKKEKQIS